MSDDRFKRLKIKLFMEGYEDIQDFLHYEFEWDEDKNVIDRRMDEVYEQIPAEKLEKFYKKFSI